MRGRLNTALPQTRVFILNEVQAVSRRDAFSTRVFGQFDGGFYVEQSGEGGAAAAEDCGVQFVAARGGGEEEDVAVGEVGEGGWGVCHVCGGVRAGVIGIAVPCDVVGAGCWKVEVFGV